MSPPLPGHHGRSAGGGGQDHIYRSTASSHYSSNSNSKSAKDYSPNLDSIDSQGPVSPQVGTTWDTETDHILSFFLSGGEMAGGGMNHPHSMMPDFASSGRGGDSGSRSREGSIGYAGSLGKDEQKRQQGQGQRLQPKYTSTRDHSSYRQRLQQVQQQQTPMDDDSDDNAPPTPAMNFYAPSTSYHHTHQPQYHQQHPYSGTGSMMMKQFNQGTGGQQHHVPMETGNSSSLPGGTMTSSSSSSSLSSAAAALVTGAGPSMYHQHPMQQQQQQQSVSRPQQQQQSNQSPVQHSPISPAALIGQGHENLMLPPASRPPGQLADGSSQQPQTTGPRPDTNSLQSAAAAASSMSERERHIAWLRDLNAMAKAAQGGDGTTAGFDPQQQLGDTEMQQQHTGGPPQLFPPPGSMHVAFPGQGAVLVPGAMMYPPGTAAALLLNPKTAKSMVSKPPPETAEKRAKRLERNRESARKSRRRKKERLAALEVQVNDLHGQIDAERRNQINAMVPAFQRMRVDSAAGAEQAVGTIQFTSPNTEIAKAVVDFQHSSLKEVILPRYHKLILWFTLQDESFFTIGKEKYAASDTNKAPTKVSTKISSKQIGDELTNGPKTEKSGSGSGNSKRRVTFKDSDRSDHGDEGVDEGSVSRPNLTPYANDAARVWPLFCYEMTFSVDQEDRFVAAHKKAQAEEGLADRRAKISTAVRTGDSLKEAVESLSGVVALREERSCGASSRGILSPVQVAAYRSWLGSNRDRCGGILRRRGSAAAAIADDPSRLETTEASLHEICRRLNEVLQISKTPET